MQSKYEVMSEINEQILYLTCNEKPLFSKAKQIDLNEKIKILSEIDVLDEGFLVVKRN